MTVTAPTLVEQQAGLLHELNEVLNRHPMGAAFRLLFAPHGLNLAEGHVLVQEVNAGRGIVELHPRQLADLGRQDVLHETQVVNPSDDALHSYALEARGWDCHGYSRPDGSTGHLYT